MYKNIFFDLDNTLWDTNHNNRECFEELYAEYGFGKYYATFEDFFEEYTRNSDELWERYLNGEISRTALFVERFLGVLRPLGYTKMRDAFAINNEFLWRAARKTRLVPGAIELLEYLRPRYRLHILSNGISEMQNLKLNGSGLAPYFDKVILSDEAGLYKPQREMFNHALSYTNSRRAESVMIGDSWDSDMVGARETHIAQIWYNPEGYPPRGFSPTYMVNSLLEIKDIL